MLVKVAEQTIKDLALLVEKQVLKSSLLLFVEHLLHNLREVAAKDRQRLLIFVQEAAEHVKKREFPLLGKRSLLSCLIWRDGTSKFCCLRVVGLALVALISVIDIDFVVIIALISSSSSIIAVETKVLIKRIN